MNYIISIFEKISNNYRSNDEIACKTLPQVEAIKEFIDHTLKNHVSNKITIELGYPSANLGYPIHDKKRLEIDSNIKRHIYSNYICDIRMGSDIRYQRNIHLENFICQCVNCTKIRNE